MTSSYESDLNIEDVIKNIKVDDMDYIFFWSGGGFGRYWVVRGGVVKLSFRFSKNLGGAG